ncbi:MAG: glycosyltransferase family 4 protein [Flavobacteriales bacterium]|nr:glycosyltransferase family 4 protein [Flavobacteriales bacterium]
MKKILFITHDCYRAGAQLLLLNYLKWLKSNKSDVVIHVLIMGEGELLNEFQQFDHFYTYPKNKISIKFFHIWLKYLLWSNKIDLVYSNTVMNQEILNQIDSFNIPVLIHVHEMNYWLNQSKFVAKKQYRYLVASNAVKKLIIEKYGIENKKIQLVYEYVNTLQLQNQTKKSIAGLLGTNNSDIVIGACGIESFRKGKDLFVPLANFVFEKYKHLNIHFVWFGGDVNSIIRKDWENSKYRSNIHFIHSIPQVSEYFADLDLFLMLSREDPFPTVNLEVGIHGIPIICFKNCGGTEELIKEDAGVAVEAFDLNIMADEIILLLKDKEKRLVLGNNLKKRILDNFDIHKTGEEIYQILNNLLSKK